MMVFLLYLGAVPLARAWLALRATSLSHALTWAGIAWAAWALVLTCEAVGWSSPGGRYGAWCLVGAAAVAVLGARRPGVAAWNFVVVGLLAVLLLPLLESLPTGDEGPKPGLPTCFLVATVLVGVGNYLPTRFGWAAGLLGLGCLLEFADRFGLGSVAVPRGGAATNACLVVVPWVAWLPSLWRRLPSDPFNRLWLTFRDRYGFVWGQRLREQFNRSAAHAGWSAELGWSGLRPAGPVGPEDAAMVTTLQALIKRFGVVPE
ncbi:MAG: hypothetical protein NZ700_14400 [Gemmataceae bacterium]|nr:hypothetical protein [Gemmataceae bacterium]MDW8265822.1 hypothetical protein [Gemmataceae bacterium]